MFGPLICKPGSSKKNKTGSWRIEFTPKFLRKNCIGCKICILTCPEACILEEEKNKYEIDLNFCKGCGICALICPKKEIEMVKEESEEQSNPTGIGLPNPKNDRPSQFLIREGSKPYKEGPNPKG